MTTLMQASHQWASRPSDERFTSLFDMQSHFDNQRGNSRAPVIASRRLEATALDAKSLTFNVGDTDEHTATHWAFGQVATLARAPAGYLRTLDARLAADCMNYGLKFKREIEDVGVLLTRDGRDLSLRAATGPNYGRIWNASILADLTRLFGNGVSDTDWRVPGEFGTAVKVDKANTTLFAGDRDMFVFLADEVNRVEVPNRRNGAPGQMARGFFVWNSEVGAATFGVKMFLFDYVCCNRIVWGADEISEITLRHTASAPDKFAAELAPALRQISESKTTNILTAIADAKAAKMTTELDDFLAKRFSKSLVPVLKAVHEAEEGRPIENRWDIVTAATAHARTIPWQDDRVAFEKNAGALLDLKAN
jgi:hypothetical protein